MSSEVVGLEEESVLQPLASMGGGRGGGEGRGGVMAEEGEGMVGLEEVSVTSESQEEGKLPGMVTSSPPHLAEMEYTIESMDGIELAQEMAAAVMKEVASETTPTSPMLAAAVSDGVQPSPSVKETVIEFAGKYSINQAAKRFNVPPNTIKKWIKGENIQMHPKFNSPGQGRKLTYSKEIDQSIADYVRDLLAKGEHISVQELCTYAKRRVQEDTPQFSASTGWAQRFLLRHGIDLGNHRPRKTAAESSTPRSESKGSMDTRGRPLSYSNETDQAIAGYVRGRHGEGQMVSNSELRKYAKEMILKENPNFTGSASWAQNFLLRHKLSLHPLGVGGGKNPLFAPPSSSPSPSTSSSSPPLSLPSHPLATIVSSMGDTTPLEPIAEITPTTTTSDLSGPSVGTDYAGVPVSDDPMKAALAILTGDIDPGALLNPAQAAALQSTLNELTTAESVSLVDLLSNAQQHTGGEGAIALITHSLETVGNALYLGLPETFAAGLTGAAATQVNPNTQAPMVPLPRMAPMRSADSPEGGQASRPLSYTKETDQALANWVQEQQAAGKKVTFASLRAYAKKLVSNENPNFNASVGWVTPFLLRHNLDLSVNKKKKQPRKSTPHKIETLTAGEAEEILLEEYENLEGVDGDQIAEETPVNEGSDALPTSNGICQSVPAATALVEQTPQPKTLSNPFGELTVQMSENPLAPQISVSAPQRPPSTEHLEVAIAPQQAAVDNPDQPMEVTIEQKFPTPLRKPKGNRVRHTLSEKLEVVRLMKEYNVAAHYVCRMLGLANSTVAGWIKLVQQKGAELEQLSANKKRANVSGQGRPLSYSKEKDEAIARWVRAQQSIGAQVTPADLAKYSTSLIGQENSHFTASSGWQQKFLQRHNLQLTPRGDKLSPLIEDQRNIPTPVQTEEVITHEFSTNLLEKPYSDEIDEHLAQWAREKLAENGSLTVQGLCHKAEELVVKTDMMFVATLGWAFKFLHRHGLILDPKPSVVILDTPVTPRKRLAEEIETFLATPKKFRPDDPAATVSPSTGNLCEALLALSNQTQEGGESSQTVQAAVQAMQSAVEALQKQQAEQEKEEHQTGPATNQDHSPQGSSSTYFGKPAREFNPEEKEEVVRYANATTLQKAALKYGVAAPTVWRWRVELKLHQPKYTPMQKKYIIKFAETNSLREASQRYGITGKTIQNWRRSLQAEGEFCTSGPLIEEAITSQEAQGELMDPVVATEETTSEMVTYDTQNFQFVVDGGEVVETSGVREGSETMPGGPLRVDPVHLEVTHEMDIENVGMEYDVVSSEGHAAKPRCTQQEKLQILEYALDHSIKEASQKFGVSTGTLYYWKKNYSSGGPGGDKPSSLSQLQAAKSGSSSSTAPTSSSLKLPGTVQSGGDSEHLQLPGITEEAVVMSSLNPAAVVSAENIVIAPEQLLSASAAATPENLQALSHTLANMTSEAIQNLPSDISLLQAVSSLLSQPGVEGMGSSSLQKRKSAMTIPRRESTSGGISSPTEVLVAPFQSTPPHTTPPTSMSDDMPQVVSTEEVRMTEGSELTIRTSEEASPPPPPSQAAIQQLRVTDISEAPDQPAIAESIEVKTASSTSSSSPRDTEALDATSEIAADDTDISQTIDMNEGNTRMEREGERMDVRNDQNSSKK